MMKDKEKTGCLICGQELKYESREKNMTCHMCGKEFTSNIYCGNGHFICNNCHQEDIVTLLSYIFSSEGKSPVSLMKELMSKKEVNLHGPEHHTLVAWALLAAYKNSGGQIDLKESLMIAKIRAEKAPGGICGYWGVCGSAIGAGIFMSIITKTTPLTGKTWSLGQTLTSRILANLAKVGGPRCCKRTSIMAIKEALDFTREEINIVMEDEPFLCGYREKNNECIGARCPYFKGA